MARRRTGASVPPTFLPAAAVIHDGLLTRTISKIVEDAKVKIATASGIDPDSVLLQVFIGGGDILDVWPLLMVHEEALSDARGPSEIASTV